MAKVYCRSLDDVLDRLAATLAEIEFRSDPVTYSSHEDVKMMLGLCGIRVSSFSTLTTKKKSSIIK